MLNPNATTRFTLGEVLSHPWMTDVCKASPILHKRRKSVCYKSAEFISKELQDFNKCSCSCHHSILSKHCEDCRDIQANNPETLLRKNIYPSNSLSSSGYGSEIFGSDVGSLFWENISPPNLSHLDLFGLELSSFDEQYTDVPCRRKSSTGTIIANSTTSRKRSHRKCSFSVLTPVILSDASEDENEDDDVIFV